MSNERRRIPRPMSHMQDDDFRTDKAVIESVIPEEVDAQTWREVIPLWAEFWVSEKGRKPFADFLDKRRCRPRMVGGDEGPNFREFVFSLFGYSEGARPANRSFPSE